MKAPVYTQAGKKAGEVELPAAVFQVAWNPELVRQALFVQRANKAEPVAHAKDRSERRGGGRKPWRQKGTGRARHGSTRSPIWRQGGVTHGPSNEKGLSKKLPKKMRQKALRSLLSRKWRDGEIVFVDSLSFSEPRTKQARDTLTALGRIEGLGELADRRRNRAFVAAASREENTFRSFRNFSNIEIREARNINPLDIARYKYLIIEKPKEFLALLDQRPEETEKTASAQADQVKQANQVKNTGAGQAAKRTAGRKTGQGAASSASVS